MHSKYALLSYAAHINVASTLPQSIEAVPRILRMRSTGLAQRPQSDGWTVIVGRLR